MAKAKYINGFTLGYSVSAKYVRDSDYHCENDYEIMYVRSGSRQVFVKDRSYVLTDGQLLFINKNELHKTSRITAKIREVRYKLLRRLYSSIRKTQYACCIRT